MMGVRSIGGKLRDAREVNGAYWDLFVYPDSEIASPTVDHIHIRGGVVLLERDPIGTRFFWHWMSSLRKGLSRFRLMRFRLRKSGPRKC